MTSTPLGPGAEFDLIGRFVERWGAGASGIGDDAALLSPPLGERLVVSTDATVEQVHFRREWMSASNVGERGATAALSDLAAMAAEPLGLLWSLILPERWRSDAEALADGVGMAARRVRCPIVGGNVSAGDELSLTFTVLGHTASPTRRNAARAGETVYVTGRLGGTGAALQALLVGTVPTPASRERFVRPVARITEARWLAARGVRAMIDISDGLLADARHLAAASRVQLRLDSAAIPCWENILPADAVRSGEEYELLLAAPSSLGESASEFRDRFGIELSAIGQVCAGASGVLLDDAQADVASGHDHLP